jgi:hypothetical protein
MSPCVSVIMPVRDGARWIGEAIGSLAVQSFADFELLVVDDGSTDETGPIVTAAARLDARIVLIAQPPSGVVAALNRGVDAARGKFIARLDADDRAHQARLQRQTDFLNAAPEVGLVGSWAGIIDAVGATVGRLQPEADPAALMRILQLRNPMVHSSVMWRAELTAAIGGYRATFEGAEDYDLWLRMAERASIANIPERLVQYRRHGGNVSDRRKLRQLFSARLARRAARGRRTGGVDPAATLAAPPDWNGVEAHDAFFSHDASLYRFLELAAREMDSPADPRFNFEQACADELPITHDERRLAQLALLHAMTAGAGMPNRRRMRLLGDFIRLHPARAVRLGGLHLLERYFGKGTMRHGS